MNYPKDIDSVIQSPVCCYICTFNNRALSRHHVFEGSANRRQSVKYGLWIWVCPECHRDIHANPPKYLWLKQTAQRRAMEFYGWTVDDFRERFGKNYL